MEQYIKKSAIVAEIDRRIKVLQKHPYENHKTICHLESLKQSLDTLEVKEVDLEKEATEFVQTKEFVKNENPVLAIAKHFFELGLKAQSNDMIEALRTEYEKGRADVIEKACEFLKSYRQDTLDGTGYISGIINDETIEEFKKVVGK